jgi:16S rRNA (cytosine967-C5)-methyltransferase
VALARERVGDRVSGFTNAVLRKVTQLAAVTESDVGQDDVTRLCQAWSHPEWLVSRWIARFGVADTEALLQWNNSHPPLVLQPTRMSVAALEEFLDEADVATTPAPFGAGVVAHASRPNLLPGYTDGEFFVQDPAQALVVRFADFASDAIVYDACAAPGGKTLALSYQVRGVIAADLSRRRIDRLQDNLARAGNGHATIVLADAAHPATRPTAAYLLDAPCLGTGTFARHADARLRVTAEALAQLARHQGELLDAAASRIAPGGVLCYATCSLEPEENEAQVTAFLQRHTGFRRQPTATIPPSLLTDAGDFQTLPQRDGVDGAFAARLVRTA